MYRRALATVCLVLGLVCTGCFDYHERIVFFRNLGGYLEIDYTVPVNPQNGHSVVAFLPIEYEAVRERYSTLFFLGRTPIENFSRSYGLGRSTDYPLLATVRYRLRFRNPAELERLLLGRATVVLRKGTLVVRRMFPTARPLPENGARLPQRILAHIQDHLEGRVMEFEVEAPPGMELVSNRGTLRAPGSLALRLPLEATLSSKEDFFWRIAIDVR